MRGRTPLPLCALLLLFAGCATHRQPASTRPIDPDREFWPRDVDYPVAVVVTGGTTARWFRAYGLDPDRRSVLFALEGKLTELDALLPKLQPPVRREGGGVLLRAERIQLAAPQPADERRSVDEPLQLPRDDGLYQCDPACEYLGQVPARPPAGTPGVPWTVVRLQVALGLAVDAEHLLDERVRRSAP